MKIAIIGAGWAGLAATHYAYKQGINVDVFEASHTLGGRARTVYNSKLSCNLDNGQHILLGAYNKTLELMQQLGLNTEDLFIRHPLHIESADNSFKIKLSSSINQLPYPYRFFAKLSKTKPADLIFLHGLINTRGISYLEKLNLALAIRTLKSKNWLITATCTAHVWLKSQKQSKNIIKNFWQPLCIAALNTPLDKACAQLFANVLRDSLGAYPRDSDILISKVNLSELWPNQLLNIENHNENNSLKHTHISVFKGKNITDLKAIKNNYDAVILACNITSSIRLLNSIGANTLTQNNFLDNLKKFEFNPISTISLQLKDKWHLPENMYMLTEQRELGFYGQWLFTNIPAFPNIANIVISDAKDAIKHSQNELISLVTKQLQQQTKRFGAMPAVVDYQIITEKRATFYAYPALWRPDVTTPWDNVFIAGDFTDTAYPAVLEGAVRSGIKAAAACVESLGQ